MLNQPEFTSPFWGEPLNQNFDTIEDKMQYKATCTYDSADNVYVLAFLNIPDEYQNQLPAVLPDLFTVVARFPNDYAEDAKIRIGATDFTPKYAAFEAGDTLAVSFNQPERACFFDGGIKEPTADNVAYTNSTMPDVSTVKDALDMLNSKVVISDMDLTAGTSPLPTGSLHFVYE